MLQAMSIPISIFIALSPMMAASQIHSDEPHTCAMPRTELATPARSVNGPSASAHRDAEPNGEAGANHAQPDQG